MNLVFKFILILIFINFVKLYNDENHFNKFSRAIISKSNSNGLFKSSTVCEICNVLLPIIKTLVHDNKTSDFGPIANYICYKFGFYTQPVCQSLIKLYEPIILGVLRESELLSIDYCDYAYNCGHSESSLLNWNVTFPNIPKPPNKPLIPPTPGSPTITILHLSDIHLDLQYQPGAFSYCREPLCCRNSSTDSIGTLAGFWGDYGHCDMPFWTLESMFEYISSNEEFDFIYYTGNAPPNDYWNQTKEGQLMALNVMTNLFQKYFPDKVIYPAVGSCDTAPRGIFPPPFVKEDDITWLYSALALNWTSTGLPKSLIPDILNGAFYTLLLYPGIRLISLNMNYCSSSNYWLFINTYDPLGQLAWLVSTLQYSEDNQEFVHIIGAFSPNSCMPEWSNNYYSIISRYEGTITGQFFGSSGYDEFELFYDLKNISRATNVAYLAPSVSTYSFLNPGYRLYTVDGFYSNTNWYVIDHSTTVLNLTEANQNNETKWQKEYTTKNALGLNSLFPQDWADLVEYFFDNIDDPRIDSMIKYYHKSSDASGKCDWDLCKKDFLCALKQANSAVHIPCKYNAEN